MRRPLGFTLIELLVVIAIIGILAAIIFPVYAQAKKSAYKSSDLSNMNSLRTALQLYKADSGAYPPALLGYVGPYENVSNGNILPPNAIKGALYPRRVESLSTFRPALDRVADNQGTQPYSAAFGANPLVTTAVWPDVDAAYRATGSNPTGQLYGNDSLVRHVVSTVDGCRYVPSVYYRVSGYDVAPASDAAGAGMETHYQLFWSGYSVPSGLGGTDTGDIGCTAATGGAGDGQDTPRQLGYTDPPETTVVTWNPFFRDYVNGATLGTRVPQHQKQDLVLFLGGSARPVDSANVKTQAWAVSP